MNGTVRESLRAGAAELGRCGIPGPGRDARRLMAAALDLAPERLVLVEEHAIPASAAAAYARMIAARARNRPVAQILGRRCFWGRAFEVTRDVLDPRPETETLIARALAGPRPGRILDLGTGSGAILVTLLCEWSGVEGLGTDLSAAALRVAARNATRHGVGARAAFRRADWGQGIEGRFELVLCNPPYLAAAEIATLNADVRDWEPHQALSPGPEGLESYRRLAIEIAPLLAPGGRALLEIGATQAEAVRRIFAKAGWQGIEIAPDLDGRDRLLCLCGPD